MAKRPVAWEVATEVAAWVGSKLAAARRWKEARERDAAGFFVELTNRTLIEREQTRSR